LLFGGASIKNCHREAVKRLAVAIQLDCRAQEKRWTRNDDLKRQQHFGSSPVIFIITHFKQIFWLLLKSAFIKNY
jgi:hypothetical protein